MSASVKIELVHHFRAPLAAVVATLEDAEYAHALVAAHSFFSEVEVLDIAVSAQNIRRTLRYRARPLFSRLGPFSLPADWFTWIEYSSFDRASNILCFENIPELENVRDKMVNRGTMRFEMRRAADGAQLTTRVARFELSLAVARLYAPLAEAALGMIVGQLKGSLDEEARFLARTLDGERVGPTALPLSA